MPTGAILGNELDFHHAFNEARQLRRRNFLDRYQAEKRTIMKGKVLPAPQKGLKKKTPLVSLPRQRIKGCLHDPSLLVAPKND